MKYVPRFKVFKKLFFETFFQIYFLNVYISIVPVFIFIKSLPLIDDVYIEEQCLRFLIWDLSLILLHETGNCMLHFLFIS